MDNNFYLQLFPALIFLVIGLFALRQVSDKKRILVTVRKKRQKAKRS